MNKVVFILIILGGGFVFPNTLICEAISNSQINKMQISYTSRQIETIDLVRHSLSDADIATGATQRIYSRTYSDSSHRGGYVVSYCNPDDNEISGNSGMSVYSRCKVANSSDDVFFSFRLDKDHNNGEVSISYLGNDILTNELTLQSCK